MPITTDKRPHIGLDPVTVDWSKFERNAKMNPKELPIGSVVYYIRKSKNRYHVDYGLVYEHYHDCVIVQRLMPRDRRLVISEFFKQPVPFKEFPYQTEWRKLPKGWSWDTRLFTIEDEEIKGEEKLFIETYTWDNPDNISEGSSKGYLVNVRDVPFETIQSVIEKANGYKLVRKSQESERILDPNRPIDTVGIDFYQCFSTYAEAKAACDKAEAELFDQADMSELEWSKYLIENDLNHWKRVQGISDENVSRARDYLFALKDLEDIETRVVMEGLQYKHWKRTKWMTVPIN